MKANVAGRHIREGVKNLARNGWMTFASVSAVTITLLLVGVFLSVIWNMNHFTKKVEKDVEIRVHIDPAASADDQTKLKQELTDIKQVESVTFSSKEEELKRVIKSFGESGKSFELFEQDNPLKDVFVVKTKEPRDTISVAHKIEKMSYVSMVQYGKGQVEKLFDAIGWIRYIGGALIVGLLFTAMFLISNTIKITIYARRTEIEIMKLVGATNWFIRWPFLLEGLLLGVLGSIVPIVLTMTSYSFIYDILTAKLEGTLLEMIPFNQFMWTIGSILLAIGAIMGMLGSVMSIRKFLRV